MLAADSFVGMRGVLRRMESAASRLSLYRAIRPDVIAESLVSLPNSATRCAPMRRSLPRDRFLAFAAKYRSNACPASCWGRRSAQLPRLPESSRRARPSPHPE